MQVGDEVVRVKVMVVKTNYTNRSSNRQLVLWSPREVRARIWILMSQNKDLELVEVTWERCVDNRRPGSSEFWGSWCGHRDQALEELLTEWTGRGPSGVSPSLQESEFCGRTLSGSGICTSPSFQLWVLFSSRWLQRHVYGCSNISLEFPMLIKECWPFHTNRWFSSLWKIASSESFSGCGACCLQALAGFRFAGDF